MIVSVSSDRRKRLECVFLGPLVSTVHQTTTARRNTCLPPPLYHYVDPRNQPLLSHWFNGLFNTSCISGDPESVVRHKRHDVCQVTCEEGWERSMVEGGNTAAVETSDVVASTLYQQWGGKGKGRGLGEISEHFYGFA